MEVTGGEKDRLAGLELDMTEKERRDHARVTRILRCELCGPMVRARVRSAAPCELSRAGGHRLHQRRARGCIETQELGEAVAKVISG